MKYFNFDSVLVNITNQHTVLFFKTIFDIKI